MSKLKLDFLGTFRAVLDSTPASGFESNKVRALLAYLVVEAQRPHSRETLAALLWPDWPDSAARSNLRYALADLRKTIRDQQADPPFLLISHDAIQFNLASDYCLDVAEIAALASNTGGEDEIERLGRALELYQGEFLEGFSVSDAAPFDDWARLKREQMHRAYQQGLHRLVEMLERSGELERALPYAWRQVEVEPLDEGAYRQVMHLLAHSGRGGEALAQYEVCRDILQKEFGAAPSAETTGLYEQIRSGELEALTPAINAGMVSQLPTFRVEKGTERPVFVAREAELERLDALLQSVLVGSGRLAFITGEAGRGKTALMREFAHRACELTPDLLAVTGSCNPYSGVSDPYLPLRSALRMLMGNVELAQSSGMLTQAHLQRLWQAALQALQALLSYGSLLVDTFISGGELLTQVREMGIDQPVLQQFVEQAANRSSQLAQQHVFEQYCGVLRTLSRNHPLLIMLDDMQWSDAASAALLYDLVTRLEGGRILVLCAYRPEETMEESGGQRHPLEKALAELKRRFGDAWLDLAEGDASQGHGFVDAFVDSEPNRLDKEFRQQLFRHTQGHALFTIELLRAMQERGDLVRDADGFWLAGPELDMDSLPARVEAVIAERLGCLDEEQRQTLSIASAEGVDFSAQVVARVKRVEEHQLLHELSHELEKRHRLVSEQDELQSGQKSLSRYRFAHALYQQYLYRQLSRAERRLLHRATAQALEELYAGDEAEISPQLAYHWGQAKDADKTREYLILAGQTALAAYAITVGEGYFRQALELHPSDAQRVVLLGGLGEALRRSAEHAEAIQVLRQGVELCRRLDDLAGMADMYRRLSLVFWWVNIGDAWNNCQEGLVLLDGAPDSPELAGFLAEAGREAFFMYDAAEAAADELCRRAIAMAERVGDHKTQAEASITLAMCIENRGGFEDSIRMLESVISFCEVHGLLESAARAHHNAGWGLVYCSIDVQAGFQHELRAAELSRSTGNSDMMFMCLHYVALAFVLLGNITSLESVLSEFLQASTTPEEQIRLFFENINHRLHYYRGEWTKALEYQRTSLLQLRNQKMLQDIAGMNKLLAMTYIELQRFADEGVLSEAEMVLVENLEFWNADIWAQVQLVAVYSLQNRFQEAHALLAEIDKAPDIFRLQAKTDLALAERCWDQAASAAQSLLKLMQSAGNRWYWARRLIDLGDIYSQREQPGDLERARATYQQSLDMFSEMEATGYIAVLHRRLQALSLQ
jgi:DNA-binding SARP family transcriptional activator/tetratricopeptide (TPR) repeat protein